MSVELLDKMGTDLTVVNAARVSYAKESKEFSGRDGKLIGFLMKNEHGCFDSETEVLTSDGWKRWPDVNGTELFATLNLATDEASYQRAERIVRFPVSGPMIRIKLAHVDALVTPDHNMVAAPRTRSGDVIYGLHPARAFYDRSYRVRSGGGSWTGSLHNPELAELVGIIAADGNSKESSSMIRFRLRKRRKIDWLASRCDLHHHGDDRYGIANPDEDLFRLAKATYDEEGNRCFPRELLRDGDSETIEALLRGYLMGDGHVTRNNKVTCTTVSRRLVDDVQEAAMKSGVAAMETSPDFKRAGAYGSRPLYKLTVYRERNLRPRIGLTLAERHKQVQTVDYQGMVYCATVPNGTLYVRRNGKPMWSGNSPFEHCVFSFRITVPLFIARQWMRTRMASYNERSGRWTEFEEEFYEPGPEIDPYCEIDEHSQLCFAKYQDLLAKGWSKENARMVLPLNLLTTFWWTVNARSLMNFLAQRSASDAQHQIQEYASKVEKFFEVAMPVSHAAFNEYGRKAP